jgi:hypothetical protein
MQGVQGGPAAASFPKSDTNADDVLRRAASELWRAECHYDGSCGV